MGMVRIAYIVPLNFGYGRGLRHCGCGCKVGVSSLTLRVDPSAYPDSVCCTKRWRGRVSKRFDVREKA